MDCTAQLPIQAQGVTSFNRVGVYLAFYKHEEEVRFVLGVCRPESSASNRFELYSVTIRKPLGLVLVDAPTGSARSVMVESVIGTFPAVTGVPLWK